MRALKGISTAIAIAGLCVGASMSANAALTFTLDTPNADLNLSTGPYGTITVTRDSATTAKVTMTAASGYAFGDGGCIGLNLTGGGFTIVDQTLKYVAVDPLKLPEFTLDPGAQLDGFGNFAFALKDKSMAELFTSLSFTVQTTGSWADETAILAANGLNGSGWMVGAHVQPLNGNLTGYAVGTPTGDSVVPEPATVLAGALLLLPFGASAVRIIRKKS